METNKSADTDNDQPPLIIRNDGNVFANITYISINGSLWLSVDDDTEYFQFKIDNQSTKPGSFNWSLSTTEWTNLTLIEKQNKTAIAYLDYNNERDNAEIDIRIKVPPSEPSGDRSTKILIIGQDT